MAILNNGQLIIDPNFFVPRGLVDARAANKEDGELNYAPGDIALPNNVPIIDYPSSQIPMPPTSYQIVDQHVRHSSDGSAVVDVTLEFPDIPGVNTIDVRITKV